MARNTENLGQVNFKVKLGETYHDFELGWSNKSKSYGGHQLFRQLASITGVPIKYICTMQIWGGTGVEPPSSIVIMNSEADNFSRSRLLSCNQLAQEVVRCKNQFDCERFVLLFKLRFYKRFYLKFELVNELAVETECTESLCHFYNTEEVLHKMRSIVMDEELNFRLKDLPCGTSEQEEEIRRRAFRQYNIYQYMKRPCNSIIYYGQTPIYSRNTG